jgi:hypothetical protein
MSSGEVVDKIVVELDYEISPHAEKEIQKYQEIGARVQKTVSKSAQKKVDDLWKESTSFFRKNGAGKTVDEMVEAFKSFKDKKNGAQQKIKANDRVKNYNAGAFSRAWSGEANDKIQKEQFEIGGKIFTSYNGRIPITMQRMLDKLKKDQNRSAEDRIMENLYQKASAKDIKKARSNLALGGYDINSMNDKEIFKTDFMNRRGKIEEKAEKAQEKIQKTAAREKSRAEEKAAKDEERARMAQRKAEERARKDEERARKAQEKIQKPLEKIQKAAARERNKKTLAEERTRTSLLRKTFRTFGVATAGFVAVNIAKKFIGKMVDLSKYSSGVRTAALMGNVSPEKMQAVEDWFKSKNISSEAGMKTLQSYSKFMKLDNLPLDKVLQKFISSVQNRSPQALRAAVAHGADADTLRVLRGYRGDVGKELGEIQKNVYTDEDLKKFDRVGNAINKFQNVLQRSKIFVIAADKLADFIEFVTKWTERILMVNLPEIKEISAEENEKIHLARVVSKAPRIPQPKDVPSKFIFSMDERLKELTDYLGDGEKPQVVGRSSSSAPSNIVVNNNFNIRSLDPEKGAQEAQEKFSRKFFEIIDTYQVRPATVK